MVYTMVYMIMVYIVVYTMVYIILKWKYFIKFSFAHLLGKIKDTLKQRKKWSYWIVFWNIAIQTAFEVSAYISYALIKYNWTPHKSHRCLFNNTPGIRLKLQYWSNYFGISTLTVNRLRLAFLNAKLSYCTYSENYYKHNGMYYNVNAIKIKNRYKTILPSI